MINVIVAIDNNGAIGRKGDLLCHLPADLRHFKEVTMGHPIVMGSKTYMSFPRRPLPGRRNIVVTRNPEARRNDPLFEGAEMASLPPLRGTLSHKGKGNNANAEQGVDVYAALGVDPEEELFVIGGGSIYAQFLEACIVDKICLTQIHHSFDDADTFFPKIDPTQWRIIEQETHDADEKNPYSYTFITLERNEQ